MICNLCGVTSCGGNGAPTPLDEYNLELEFLGDGELQLIFVQIQTRKAENNKRNFWRQASSLSPKAWRPTRVSQAQEPLKANSRLLSVLRVAATTPHRGFKCQKPAKNLLPKYS